LLILVVCSYCLQLLRDKPYGKFCYIHIPCDVSLNIFLCTKWEDVNYVHLLWHLVMVYSSEGHMLNLRSQIVQFILVYLDLEDGHGKEHFSHKPCEKETGYLWGTRNTSLLFTLFQNCKEEEIYQSREEAVWIQLAEIKTHASCRQIKSS